MTASPVAERSVMQSLLRDRSFLVAVAVLVIAAGTWRVAVAWLKISLRREAVPWPAHVKVSEGFCNVSFPTTMGPYKQAAKDGETRFEPQMLETLGMGTSLDKSNVGKRISNWYMSRTYEDTRQGPLSPQRYWSVNVTYYTGGLDTVPHIPEVCWSAGGMQILETKPVTIRSPEGLPKPWSGDVSWRRVLSSNPDMRQFLVYYIFSLNGLPEESREEVRLKLMNPRLKYCYFAKIEISPRVAVTDTDEMDRKAKDFIQTCLPAVLKDLPLPEDIQRLSEESK
jgi:hypothetical protein